MVVFSVYFKVISLPDRLVSATTSSGIHTTMKSWNSNSPTVDSGMSQWHLGPHGAYHRLSLLATIHPPGNPIDSLKATRMALRCDPLKGWNIWSQRKKELGSFFGCWNGRFCWTSSQKNKNTNTTSNLNLWSLSNSASKKKIAGMKNVATWWIDGWTFEVG